MAAEVQAAPFAVGDIVELKSGSDPMTVESCEEGASVKCVWFNAAMSRFDRESFQPTSITSIGALAKPST